MAPLPRLLVKPKSDDFMPMLMPNENDPPMQRLLHRLTMAGWVQGFASKDMPNMGPGGAQMHIEWTPKGRQMLAIQLSLIQEIEKASGEIKNDEFPFMKVLAVLAVVQGGAPPQPPMR